MQITLEVPDELIAQAEARGLTPESYARSLIANGVLNHTAPLPPAKPKMDMEKFFEVMAAYSDKIPELPDAAFTRESFYQDHD
jgi:hypothetical protein